MGAPGPRANTAACVHNNKIYVYGGHGGASYARIAYNDLYTFDLDTNTWDKIEYDEKSNSPDPRGGHTMFAIDKYLYVYGGWNNEAQYNNILRFDLETL